LDRLLHPQPPHGAGGPVPEALSNTNPEHFQIYQQRFPSASLFDGYVVSHEAGMRKPNPEIFKLALKRMEVTAEQVFYVDDIETNVLAAQALGMHAVHYKFNDVVVKRAAEALGLKPAWIAGRTLKPKVL
jgi:FMN phosphatase YigB (HAD superfamily)